MPGEYELGDLSGVLGSNLYDSLFSSQGFSGYNDGTRGEGPIWASGFGNGVTEGGGPLWWPTPNEDAMSAFDNYTFNWQPQGGQAGMLTAFDPQGNLYGTYRQKGEDNFTKLVGMVAPMIATSAFGGALSSMFGGGFLGNAAGYGLASGSMTAAQGGNFGKGFLGGAVSGGLQGLGASGNSPAKFAGIENPTLAKMFNRGAGGTLGALASGKSGSEALQSGVMGAGLAGANALGSQAMDFIGNAFKGLMTPEGGTEADYSMGDTSYGSNYNAPGQSALRMAGIYPEMSNVPPSSSNFQTLDTLGLPSYDSNPYANASYAEGGYKPNGVSALEQAGLRGEMSYALPGSEGDYGGSFLNSILSDNGPVPDQSIQSPAGQFSLQSVLGDVGSRVGNFALNNAGDLASMLYGFYNNRRQQRQLQQPMNNMSNQVNQATTQLQNMFTQNSPYAQQLRAKLNAQAAASGRRSNVAGRETQFQAMLAEKAASTLPQIANMQNSLMQNQLQMQQQQGRLKNSNMNDVLKFAKQSGLLGMAGQGLKNLFSNDNTYAGGGYNMTGVQDPYGVDVIFNGWGG